MGNREGGSEGWAGSWWAARPWRGALGVWGVKTRCSALGKAMGRWKVLGLRDVKGRIQDKGSQRRGRPVSGRRQTLLPRSGGRAGAALAERKGGRDGGRKEG